MGEIKIGTAQAVVNETNTAKTVGSGGMDVYATPAMIALIEQAAFLCSEEVVKEGETTVGISMNVSHDAPTPIGMKVTAKAELQSFEGRKMTFCVEAADECGVIGKGVHERFVVNQQSFQKKANAKLPAND